MGRVPNKFGQTFGEPDPGDYDFIIERPSYNDDMQSGSILAKVTGGDGDGLGLFDNYPMGFKVDEISGKEKRGKYGVPFGVQKLAALIDATGLENIDIVDDDYEENLKKYYHQLWGKLRGKDAVMGLLTKLEGRMFHGKVEQRKDAKDKVNITEYARVGEVGGVSEVKNQTQQSETGKSW